jgi:hypothetical protein
MASVAAAAKAAAARARRREPLPATPSVDTFAGLDLDSTDDDDDDDEPPARRGGGGAPKVRAKYWVSSRGGSRVDARAARRSDAHYEHYDVARDAE